MKEWRDKVGAGAVEDGFFGQCPFGVCEFAEEDGGVLAAEDGMKSVQFENRKL